MTLRLRHNRRKGKLPENYVRRNAEGHGLWTVYSATRGGQAEECRLPLGNGSSFRPVRFITYPEARQYAINRAAGDPERRYKVVLVP